MLMLGLIKMLCSVEDSIGYLLEQSQDECLEPTQRHEPDGNQTAEG